MKNQKGDNMARAKSRTMKSKRTAKRRSRR